MKKYIQCMQKVDRPLEFFQMLLRYRLILKWIKSNIFLNNLNTIPHNDKVKTVFLFFYLQMYYK